MYYELYIDILYLVNFMMDFLVLLLVREVTKCSTTHLRLTLSSLISAGLTCIVIIIPMSYASIKFILFHVVINTMMICIGFKVKTRNQFFQCMISLYLASFLLGGVLQYFNQYLKISSLYFMLSVISYWLVKGFLRFTRILHREEKKWCTVRLFLGNESVELRALLDTGNSLVDPYSGLPVSIVEEKALKQILDSAKSKGVEKYERYIPFHSLGHQGVLLVIRAEKIYVQGEKEHLIEHPLIGISEDGLSKDQRYEMILNPDIL